MLAVVKDIDLCADGFGCNQEGVLGHVPRSVHLAIVVDGLQDVHLRRKRKKKCSVKDILKQLLQIATVTSMLGSGEPRQAIGAHTDSNERNKSLLSRAPTRLQKKPTSKPRVKSKRVL